MVYYVTCKQRNSTQLEVGTLLVTTGPVLSNLESGGVLDIGSVGLQLHPMKNYPAGIQLVNAIFMTLVLFYPVWSRSIRPALGLLRRPERYVLRLVTLLFDRLLWTVVLTTGGRAVQASRAWFPDRLLSRLTARYRMLDVAL